MRLLRIALLVFCLSPSTAQAADASIASRDLPLGGSRTLSSAQAPKQFDLVGLHWQGSGTVAFRTRSVAGRWSVWQEAEAENLPDSGSSERAARRGWRLGNPYWTGRSDRIQWRVSGQVRRLRAYFVRSPAGAAAPLRTISLAGSPAIAPRDAWEGDELIRRRAPLYAPAVRLAIVHHTAGTNAYSREQSAAIVRGIALYHVQGNGWNDVGYNFLVDRYGQVFEGRYGGIERNVVGAHAAGFNTGSVGVAVIGNFVSQAPPPAARLALTRLLAWRLDVAHVDPLSTVAWVSRGNRRFPAGVSLFLRAISGHRDTDFTECPGSAFYPRLNEVARQAAALGLPKLYDPVVRGSLGGTLRFSARLTTALPWSVAVRGPDGSVVARGSGHGPTVAWMWNSAGVPAGRYVWTIEAGSTVRPATGTIGASSEPPPPPKPPVVLLSGFQVAPSVVSPNGDGFADTATITYALGARSAVTVSVLDAGGAPVQILFSEQMQSARVHSFPWNADVLTDGRYLVTVTAVSVDGRTASASAAVVVDRILSALTVQPAAPSPNGDGVDDSITVSFGLARMAQVRVEIAQGGLSLLVLSDAPLQPGQQTLTWNGMTPAGPLVPGRYDVVVTAFDELGQVSQSAGFDVAP